MTSLKAELKAARKRTAHGSWFVPRGSLRGILNRQAVSNRLSESQIPLEVRDEVLERVLHDASSLFGVLVRIEQEHLIADCLSHDLRDEKLPVGPEAMEGLGVDPRFFDKQWEFLAPVFERRNVLLRLKDRHVLPFLEDRRMSDSEGAYANAFRVTLDARHQDLVKVEHGEQVSLSFKLFLSCACN
jgi:hypothetical protein